MKTGTNWAWAILGLPAAWLCVQIALRFQAECQTEAQYAAGCSTSIENFCWLTSLICVFMFARGVDRILKEKGIDPWKVPDDQP